jgi:chemotaxis protein CheX
LTKKFPRAGVKTPRLAAGKFLPPAQFHPKAPGQICRWALRMIDDLADLLKAAVVEVFGTMIGLQVQPEAPNTPIISEGSTIAGAVGFIGKLTGVVYIYSPVPFALRLTEKIVGVEPNEIDGDEMVNDSMGELANMIVGHLKSRLSDRGHSCVMTIPSIVRGTNFQIEPVSSTVRRVFSFRSLEHQLVVEILLKPDEKIA